MATPEFSPIFRLCALSGVGHPWGGRNGRSLLTWHWMRWDGGAGRDQSGHSRLGASWCAGTELAACFASDVALLPFVILSCTQAHACPLNFHTYTHTPPVIVVSFVRTCVRVSTRTRTHCGHVTPCWISAPQDSIPSGPLRL